MSLETGDVFFCFSNAEKYLTQEVFKKSSSIYCEIGFLERIGKFLDPSKIDKYLNKIHEIKNLKTELIKQLQEKYSQPDYIVAITGTKGKTSTAWFTMQMLGLCNIKCGYIGTIGVYLHNSEKIEKINKKYTLTTPSIDELYYYIDLLKKKNANVIVIEASSHALQQERIEGLKICCGCFTNFSQDHLDYHGTMENYFHAKSLLFSKYLDKNGICITNDKDEKSYNIKEICLKRNITVKTIGDNCLNDFSIKSINKDKNKQNVIFTVNNVLYSFDTKILGEFQILNILEAIAICYFAFKIKCKLLCNIAKKINSPIGRVQNIPETNIFIDFAHTPKSLEEVINLLKERYDKIVVIFGCGGDRDRLKRPIMFEIARKIANIVILTNDNPRSEEPSKIIEDMLCFYNKNKTNELTENEFVKNEINTINTKYINNVLESLEIIEDRSKAITFAIKKFYNNSKYAILIAGKGHENYQIIGNNKKHFNDEETAQKAIKLIKKL